MDVINGAQETTGVANVGELLANLGTAFALGAFVTFVLLVGEFVFEQIVEKKTMILVCMLSDLLFGPVTVIAFFHRDSFSTILFLAIVWHWLCDLEIKCSTIFIPPRSSWSFAQRLNWFQAFWKMLHHLATAVIKFGTDMGRLSVSEKFDDRGNVGVLFFFYLVGTSLIHLSTATGHFGAEKISVAMLTLALCLKLGMGFCMWYIFWPTQSPWRYLGLTDNVWTLVYISTFVIPRFLPQEKKEDDGVDDTFFSKHLTIRSQIQDTLLDTPQFQKFLSSVSAHSTSTDEPIRNQSNQTIASGIGTLPPIKEDLRTPGDWAVDDWDDDSTDADKCTI